MLHYATAEKGKLIFNDLKSLEIQLCSLENKAVSVDVKKVVQKRTNPQNDYYFGIVIPIAIEGFRDTGNLLNAEEVHEFFKQRFNFKLVEIKGHSVKVGKSTTKLSTGEFSEYIKKIRDFAEQWLSVYIPEPNEK